MKIKMDKQLWMKVHTYLSLFFLTAAFIYALTGVLYIFEIRQNSGAQIWKYPIESIPQKEEAGEVILNILQQNNLEIPSDTKIKNIRGNFSMGNVYYGATILKDRDGQIIVQVTKRNLYGVLMLMHKSVGTKFELGSFKFSFFDFIAIGFGISMFLFYFSGLVITSFCKKRRLSSFITFFVGFIITALAVYFSL